MLGRLVLLFITVSVLEIWVLIRISAATSFWFTLALCGFTFFLGSSLVRGVAANIQARTAQALQRGEPPAGAMAAGLLDILAGVLLMMPGVLSDIVGALLVLPPMRNFARKRLAQSRFASAQSFSQFGFQGGFPGGFSAQPPSAGDNPRAKSTTKGTKASSFESDSTPFETDLDDGYTPPQPSKSGSVIIDAEIVD